MFSPVSQLLHRWCVLHVTGTRLSASCAEASIFLDEFFFEEILQIREGQFCSCSNLKTDTFCSIVAILVVTNLSSKIEVDTSSHPVKSLLSFTQLTNLWKWKSHHSVSVIAVGLLSARLGDHVTMHCTTQHKNHFEFQPYGVFPGSTSTCDIVRPRCCSSTTSWWRRSPPTC